MSISLRERILSVYSGKPVDAVPFMLDLSHWFYSRNRFPWDLSQAYEKPETELIDYHKQKGVGFYLPNLASFFSVEYTGEVTSEVEKRNIEGSDEIVWRYLTPVGSIERSRVWEEDSYSWGIRDWGVKSPADIKTLAYALSNRKFTPKWENFNEWTRYVGDTGVVYLPLGYSAMGYLLCYWMGIEATLYAAEDYPEVLEEAVERINQNNLQLVDMAANSPAQIVLMGDNFSSDVQSPRFFERWSKKYYCEAIRRLHRAGKYVAVHIDGRLRGALEMIWDTGADCADAVTPLPLGDLSAEECRTEAGNDFILSGGVSPDLWLPNAPERSFRDAVLRWLELKHKSPRIIANAGDQVPPGACEERIEIMRDMVEKYGQY